MPQKKIKSSKQQNRQRTTKKSLPNQESIHHKPITKTPRSSIHHKHASRTFWNHFLKQELFKSQEACNSMLFQELATIQEFTLKAITKDLVVSYIQRKGRIGFHEVQDFYKIILKTIENQPIETQQKYSNCIFRLKPWFNKIMNKNFEKLAPSSISKDAKKKEEFYDSGSSNDRDKQRMLVVPLLLNQFYEEGNISPLKIFIELDLNQTITSLLSSSSSATKSRTLIFRVNESNLVLNEKEEDFAACANAGYVKEEE